MAVVDQASTAVPLSLFSGWDTELSPSDIPEGISPDNQDVVFTPGAVATRPAIQRVFVSALRAAGSLVYEKSFVLPNGAPKNLYFTSDGTLWVEDLLVSPGVATVLFSSSASCASSVTAFGREYIALSNRTHGADVPIQYDGTNVYRVTQDGPGVGPTIESIAIPESALVEGGSGSAVDVVSASPFDPVTVTYPGGPGYYSNGGKVYVPPTPARSVTTYRALGIVTETAHGLSVGDLVVISGNTLWNFSVAEVAAIVSPSAFDVAINSTIDTVGTGGTVQGQNPSLSRSANSVTAVTRAPHGLLTGYQAQISGTTPTAVGGGIASIVIDNEDQPGLALITMDGEHGLLPNNFVNIANIPPTAVGGGISSIVRSGDIVTVTTETAHGLGAGALANIAGVTDSSFDGQFSILSVPTTTTFTYTQVDVDATSSAGTVTVSFPLANANPSENFFTVLSAPSTTTFYVAISYPDGSWGSGGTVTFAWDGTFYVTSVLSTTQFTYQQYGPNAVYQGNGIVTPYGQATPGVHQCQLLFMLASGAITAPSPPVSFIANGGQYLSISNIAIGTSNVVGRILQFTGAGGAYYFYIPLPAQVNGLYVATATQINDNTTTSVVLDFSDNTLYAALATSIPGNNLAAQVVLGPCAGFFTYASRLQAWGEYNKIQKFVNMGFDGGYVTPNQPAGWTVSNSGGTLVAGRVGAAWQIAVNGDGAQYGNLSQNAATSAFDGSSNLPSNGAYTLRVWLACSKTLPGLNFYATLTSASTGFTSTATINGLNITAAGGFVEANFSSALPAIVPLDLTLTIYATSSGTTTPLQGSATLQVDELELIDPAQPYIDNQERMSYANNPEGFDGLTGIFGPEDDQSPIRNHGVIRNTLYIVTGNGLHETSDNDTTEPSGWGVDNVADNCGAWSIASVGRNAQGIGCAGKDWMAWSGPDGAQIFTGQKPEKVSQEIQSAWDGIDQSLTAQCWTKNDQTNKRCYFGVPLGPATMQVLVLDYRNLDGEAIASSPPVRISFTGKMIASDLTRKWTRWNINAYSGELIYRYGIPQPQMVFGTGTNGANAYTLNPAKYTDDDFGQIMAYYITYFFVSHDMEQQLQVGSHRKEYDYLAAYVPGIGTVTFTPLGCALTNPFPATPPIALNLAPNFDLEIGLNVITSRCAFKIAAAPLIGQTDTYFSLQKLIINMKKAPWTPVRGSNGGGY